MPSIPVSTRHSDTIFTSAPLIAALGDGFPMAPEQLCLWKSDPPRTKESRKTVIRGMSFLIYSLAKNKAGRGVSVRGIVQIIITYSPRRRTPNDCSATTPQASCSFLNLRTPMPEMASPGGLAGSKCPKGTPDLDRLNRS